MIIQREVGLTGNRPRLRVRVIDRQDFRLAIAEVLVRADETTGVGVVAGLALIDVHERIEEVRAREHAPEQSTGFEGCFHLAMSEHRFKDVGRDRQYVPAGLRAAHSGNNGVER